MRWQLATILALALAMTACSSSRKGAYYKDDGPPSGSFDVAKVDDAVPRQEPPSKTGNKPYVVFGKSYTPMRSSEGFTQRGTASWYGKKFHGKRTSSGETYDMYKMTAAHTVLPIPSYVKVTNLNNRRSVVVRVNDRGPFKSNRILDLSYAAALRLGVVESGTAPVEIVAITAGGKAGKSSPVGVTGLDPGAQLFIQLGAFSNREAAYRLQQRLRSDGYSDVIVSQAMVNGISLFRVRIGPISEQAKSDFVLADLHQAGYPDARYIVD
jgi:rare lipoprotein A